MIRIKNAHFHDGKLDEESMKKLKDGFNKKKVDVEEVKEEKELVQKVVNIKQKKKKVKKSKVKVMSK